MNKWYKYVVGDGAAAYQPSMNLHDKFIALAVAKQIPEVCAVLSHYDSGLNLVTWYFSPGMEALAKQYQSVECDKPVREGLSMLSGNLECWNKYYPNPKGGE